MHKVYVIHGFAGWRNQLFKINRTICREGYESELFTYNSFTEDVEDIAKRLYDKILSEAVTSISFVTHSMGALIVRSMHQHISSNPDFPPAFRMVMLAPPNAGSPVADFFYRFRPLRKLAGPNLKNLTTHQSIGAKKYPLPSCEIGLVIARRGKNKGYNPSCFRQKKFIKL